jgi:hypothetical protein
MLALARQSRAEALVPSQDAAANLMKNILFESTFFIVLLTRHPFKS